MTQPKLASSYITGFCASGQHEKTTLKSPKGLTLRACEGRYLVHVGPNVFGAVREIVCTCDCHAAFREIAQMMGLMDMMHGFGETVADAPVKENPAPIVPTPVAVLPAPGIVEPLLPVAPPPIAMPTQVTSQLLPFQRTGFKPTPTGRAARGQLEDKIRQIVQEFHELAAGMLTPEAIGKMINRESPPSNGAIHACLTRWSDRGWVTLEKKPFRLGVVTEGGKRNLFK